MIHDIFNITFHVMVNSFIVFFIIACLIEFFLFIFRIKNERIRFLCRLLPIIKLPLDFLLYKIFNVNYLVNFNPFSCDKYLYTSFLKLLSPSLRMKFLENTSLTIPDWIVAQVSVQGLSFIVGFLFLFWIIIIGFKVFKILNGKRFLDNLFRGTHLCNRSITNPKLLKTLNDKHVIIMSSQLVSIPIAAKGRYIVFPSHLIHKLSQEEYESIVAHELEHLRWGDPAIKMACHLIAAIFWWIPTRFWLKKLEFEQENASDSAVYKYGIPRHTLASAIVKVIDRVKKNPHEMKFLCQIVTPKSVHFQRLENILNFTRVSKQIPYEMNYIIGMIMCVLSFASFWIC